MSNGPHGKPGRRVKDARGFKIKAFDALHKKTYWFSKTYCSLRNVKLAIAHSAFDDYQFITRDWRACVELFIYDVSTWMLAAVRKCDEGTSIIDLSEHCNEPELLRYWRDKAGEWEDDVKEESDEQQEM